MDSNSKQFNILSAILGGNWLVQKEWANEHMMLILNLLDGKGWPAEMQTKVVASSDSFGDSLEGPVSQFENIRIIEISGPMSKYGGMCSYGTTDYINAVQAAYYDDSVEAVVIKVDSPGGDARRLAELFDVVHSQYKPVVAYIHDIAASGGIYAIAGATYIMASQPTDLVGSIGVFTTIRDYSERLKAMGVTETAVYSRLSTEKNGVSRLAEAGDMSALEDSLDVVAQDFIDNVKLGRGDRLNLAVGDPFKGKTFFASDKNPNNPDALSIGLIDGIGSFGSAIEKAQSLAAERRTSIKSNFISNNSLNMFGDKYPLMTALRGVAAADVTEESLNALNAQLAEKGITGILAVSADWVTEAEGLLGQVSAKDLTINGLKTQVSDKDALILSLTAERDNFKATAEELGKLPAAEPANPILKEQEGPKLENPFLTQTDIDLAAMKARMQPSLN